MATRESIFRLTRPRPLAQLSDYLAGLVRARLWLQVLAGMILGVTVGIALGPDTGWVTVKTAATVSNWIALPGQLFLALIQMIVIPLIVASVVRGLSATESGEQLKRLGGRTLVFFVITTALAIVIGLGVALAVEPGSYIDSRLVHAAPGSEIPAAPAPVTPSLGELPQKLLGLLPRNPLTSMVEGQMLQVVLFAIIVLALVLESVGIPPAGIALIIGVDRILDMSRTAINVCGDLVAARIIDRAVAGQRASVAA